MGGIVRVVTSCLKRECADGVTDWNIPKHLASFDFKEDQDGTTHVQVFPHDTTGDPSEAAPSRKPFFRARFKPIPYVPSFPVSTRLAKYVGYDLSFAQPPVPEGNTSQGELSGTDKWCALTADESSRKASLGWFDLRQADEQGNTTSEFENFWPGLKRWKLGLKMEDTDFDISEGRYWEPPKSTL